MRVRCISLRADDSWDEASRRLYEDEVGEYEVALNVGTEYVVYGVIYRNGLVRYLIRGEPDYTWVTPECFLLFEIVDPAIPDGWEFVMHHRNAGGAALLPREWARDGMCLEKLADADPEALATFERLQATYNDGPFRRNDSPPQG